ncbi:MAG: DUF177 domain-containing protein [Firmicutes bacterium]|nr:DUF177 domain-containing protein [Bacillota bacterium]
MKIDVGELHKKGSSHNYDLRGDLPDLRVNEDAGEARFPYPLRTSGMVTNSGLLYIVQGTVETTVVLSCSRCLEVFEAPLRVAYTQGFKRLTEEPLQNQDGNREDEDLQHFEADEIVLDGFLKDILITELPMKPLCREECRGLCPRCGANRNLAECGCELKEPDQRWGKLAAFSRTLGSKGEDDRQT